MSKQDFKDLEQLKGKVASLDVKSELYYVLEAKINETWYLVCIDDTNSTESYLKVERIIDYHNQKNVTRKWFQNGLIDNHMETLLQLSKKRKADLDRK